MRYGINANLRLKSLPGKILKFKKKTEPCRLRGFIC
uniref:Uncharacterized protein n=1 Tax=Siphoviridae sp. ctYBm1 TaxID=2826374 RepID=A0A8S5LS09_9CAUD|nr:MAG TPA: hypothetical protein [Siphoviridae sp. ctYBm1]